MATVALLGTLDTKGDEFAYVADRIRERGHDVMVIDVGTGGPPQIAADVPREEVARIGGFDLGKIAARGDRGECVAAMARAASLVLSKLHQQAKFDGVLSLGGGGGTAIGTAAMRALPIGVPKLMVTTLASGDTSVYVGTTDITMMPSIVDVAGLNRISKTIFSRAAGAICGMIEASIDSVQDTPLLAASMFGNTTECVSTAKALLEQAGYEVLVFHATGAGGRTMEGLVASGLIAGVLDVTTTEWADQLVGGILSAGPDRLDAAGVAGVPSVVVPGCLDMVNFGPPDSVPKKFAGRKFYEHNPQVTLMRTSVAESAELGRILARKVNAYRAAVTVLVPARGLSAIGVAGQPFHDPEADRALFKALEKELRGDIPLITMDCAVNDPDFAGACAEALLANLRNHSSSNTH